MLSTLATLGAGVTVLAGPAAATAADVGAVVVKLDERRGPEGTSDLPASLTESLRAALGVPFAATGRARNGAFTLALATPLPIDAVRAALNRVRLDPRVLYANAATDAPAPVTGGLPTSRIIVRYRGARGAVAGAAAAPPDAARMDRLASAAGGPLAWLRSAHDGADVLQMLQRLPVGDVEAIAARIAQDPDVDYAQPDYIRTKQAAPADPCYASPGVPACAGDYQWNLFDPLGGINMPPAWDITTGAPGIRIAVIDTGVLYGHPDLAGRFVGGYDMVADCAVGNDGQPGPCTWAAGIPNMNSRDPDAADPGDWITAAESAGFGASMPPYDWFKDCREDTSSWHGTHVAGTIGALPNNGVGIAGINWVSKILPVRVLGKCGGYSSDIDAAMVWAAGGGVPGLPPNANPARVLNVSLGGPGACDAASQQAIDKALALGAVVVAAAGNENENASGHWPASCNGVITVAATTKAGRRARYTNYGSAVEIAAPGGNADGLDPDVLSTLNTGATTPDPSGYVYVSYAGTSMATPHVSGVASLMLSANPALTPAQVLAKIQTTARAFPGGGPTCNPVPQPFACNCTTALCGAGILDAGAAVAAALGGTALASSANPAAVGAAVTFTATVAGNAPTGTVKFEDGSTPLTGCVAVPLAGSGSPRTAACVAPALAAGSHVVTATYSGDGNNPSSSASLTQTMIGASTTTLASSANPALAGASVTFTATVVGTVPTGTVTFTDGVTAIAGCSSVALAGSGNTRTAACAAGVLAAGTHPIAAAYSGDAGNVASNGTLSQVVAAALPGTATVATNPYGPLGVQGATLVGNTISNFTSNAVIQLGNVAGTPGAYAVINFQGLGIGPGNRLTIRSGAPGQFVFLVNTDATQTVVAGELVAPFTSFAPANLYVKSPQGIVVAAGGLILGGAGLGLESLGVTWTQGGPLRNDGVIDAGPVLEMIGARINGGGEFRGDAITIRTFGNANNPVNGAYFLQNGLDLQSGHGTGPTTTVALTLNAYGSAPQVLNLKVRGNAIVSMPSAWPAGVTAPANNAVVPPGGTRPAGQPDPAYGGGSMIVQAEGTLTLAGGSPGDFVFPGGIALKADGPIDLNGVLVNQGWTTSGKSFQGVFFEAPAIGSSAGNLRVYGNDLNWINFSTFPATPLRAFTLMRNPDGRASFAPADTTAPHLNTYSTLVNAAASGGCWTCLVNPLPVNMYGP